MGAAAILDRNIVKEALKELIHEEPAFFKTIFKEILEEDSHENDEFETIIQKNFKRFDATFRALA